MKTKFDSFITSSLPEGCKLCVTGEKSVLFLGGKCSRNCWYCSLSDTRKNEDRSFINERPISRLKDLFLEIKANNSKGVGITGGDPLVYFNKTLKYSKYLKKKFGKAFHIHIYLPLNLVNQSKLMKLVKYVDEVRFHPTFIAHSSKIIKKSEFSKIQIASKIFGKNNVGIEVPMIPEKKSEIYEFIFSLKDDLGFVNLNEFELSETNFNRVTKKYSLNDDTQTIFGSLDAGKWILKNAKRDKLLLKFHLCTAKTKDHHQYINRMKKHSILPYGNRINNGNVVYFSILDNSFRVILRLRRLTPNFFNDRKNKRILLNMGDVLKIYDNTSFKIYRIEEQPFFGNNIVEKSLIGEP